MDKHDKKREKKKGHHHHHHRHHSKISQEGVSGSSTEGGEALSRGSKSEESQNAPEVGAGLDTRKSSAAQNAEMAKSRSSVYSRLSKSTENQNASEGGAELDQRKSSAHQVQSLASRTGGMQQRPSSGAELDQRKSSAQQVQSLASRTGGMQQRPSSGAELDQRRSSANQMSQSASRPSVRPSGALSRPSTSAVHFQSVSDIPASESNVPTDMPSAETLSNDGGTNKGMPTYNESSTTQESANESSAMDISKAASGMVEPQSDKEESGGSDRPTNVAEVRSEMRGEEVGRKESRLTNVAEVRGEEAGRKESRPTNVAEVRSEVRGEEVGRKESRLTNVPTKVDREESRHDAAASVVAFDDIPEEGDEVRTYQGGETVNYLNPERPFSQHARCDACCDCSYELHYRQKALQCGTDRSSWQKQCPDRSSWQQQCCTGTSNCQQQQQQQHQQPLRGLWPEEEQRQQQQCQQQQQPQQSLQGLWPEPERPDTTACPGTCPNENDQNVLRSRQSVQSILWGETGGGTSTCPNENDQNVPRSTQSVQSILWGGTGERPSTPCCCDTIQPGVPAPFSPFARSRLAADKHANSSWRLRPSQLLPDKHLMVSRSEGIAGTTSSLSGHKFIRRVNKAASPVYAQRMTIDVSSRAPRQLLWMVAHSSCTFPNST